MASPHTSQAVSRVSGIYGQRREIQKVEFIPRVKKIEGSSEVKQEESSETDVMN